MAEYTRNVAFPEGFPLKQELMDMSLQMLFTQEDEFRSGVVKYLREKGINKGKFSFMLQSNETTYFGPVDIDMAEEVK